MISSANDDDGNDDGSLCIRESDWGTGTVSIMAKTIGEGWETGWRGVFGKAIFGAIFRGACDSGARSAVLAQLRRISECGERDHL